MFHILLIIHVIIIVAMVGLILIQRSSQDGLSGLGGGSNNSFLSGRASANLLTRSTGVLAAAFMIMSLSLAYLTSHSKPASILDKIDTIQSQIPIPAPTAPVTEPKKQTVPVAK